MRIPLDYYRILGVPIQTTDNQLSQAYHDRGLQLPRREYSDVAISARKQLLDEAYSVLADEQRRSEYDTNFLGKAYEPERSKTTVISLPQFKGEQEPELEIEPRTSWIEIDDNQFSGALLILQELGEYELVLQLGNPVLGNQDTLGLAEGRLGDPKLVKVDIVLTIALACLELCREQWQQGQYEKAATSGKQGQELLLQEGLLPNVRGELQADLFKLRPYRILELLALPEEQLTERNKGLQLLREMLQERGGIDGTGDDQSGLSVDDFLRFIQQLRNHLSAAEQQALFEAESRRPSAVATYLAVYALLARGFAQKQPSLIARGKEMLLRLSKRQDVHLEQAVCCLLLGQTEEATRALELSQEYEPLAFIREHSQGSPDLLPGLCLYGERWLQTEVFPHFRDLASQKALLKDYFANEQVQEYLEKLPENAGHQEQSQWSVVEPELSTEQPSIQDSNKVREESQASQQVTEPMVAYAQYARKQQESIARGEQPLTATVERGAASGVSTLSTSLQVDSTLPDTQIRSGEIDQDVSAKIQRLRQRRGQQPTLVPINERGESQNDNSPPSYRSEASGSRSPKIGRLLLVGGGAIAILLFAFFLLRFIFGQIFPSSTPSSSTSEQLQISLNQPPIEIPPEVQSATVTPEALTADLAEEVIQNWLAVKAQAFGPNHQIDQLETVLVEPSLSRFRGYAQDVNAINAYRQYSHRTQVDTVQSTAESDQATVIANVREEMQEYQNGAPSNSDVSNLRVRYELVRENGKWFISRISVD